MIEFTDVVKSYSEGNYALNGVNMQIEDGEFCFLVGPSGSGKSTIIKMITGELKPTSGTVHVNGYSLERIRKREIPFLRRTVGVVFQDFRLIDNMTVYENVAFAMRVIGSREREIKERVPYVLELVGLTDKQLRVALTDAAMDSIIDQGFDPTFGARPLKRYLQSKVETLIARRIIAADVKPGSLLTVDADETGKLFVK